ncbi:MAG: hypothetical protein AAF567_09365 [Actinomycetota bacterium]
MALKFPEPPASTSTRFANLALGLDAAFCNIVGLVFTLTGAFMADWLGVPGWVATVFGVVVLMWSFVVTLFANRRVSRRREVDFVLRVNLAFVVIALVVIVWPGALSDAGRVVLGLGAAIVAAFAVAQFYARRDLA